MTPCDAYTKRLESGYAAVLNKYACSWLKHLSFLKKKLKRTDEGYLITGYEHA